MDNSRSRLINVFGLVAVIGLLVGACAGAGTAEPGSSTSESRAEPIKPRPAEVVCHLKDDRLAEISGLAASLVHPGILWTHNDSGDSARVFAIDANDCSVRAVVAFAGVLARDIEAIGVGRDEDGTPVLWLADIGDNKNKWPNVRLYRAAEPAQLSDQKVAVATFTVRYADGPHNAEALLVDPSVDGPIWIATKRDAASGGIYRVPQPPPGKAVAVAQRVGEDAALTTDGSYAPDGRLFVLRTYSRATVFAAPLPGSNPVTVTIPLQRQGEAIAFSADSSALYLASERSDELWRLRLR